MNITKRYDDGKLKCIKVKEEQKGVYYDFCIFLNKHFNFVVTNEFALLKEIYFLIFPYQSYNMYDKTTLKIIYCPENEHSPIEQYNYMKKLDKKYPKKQFLFLTTSPYIYMHNEGGINLIHGKIDEFEEGWGNQDKNYIVHNRKTIRVNWKGWYPIDLLDCLLLNANINFDYYNRNWKWKKKIEKAKNLIAGRRVFPITEEGKQFLRQLSQDIQLYDSDPCSSLLNNYHIEWIIKDSEDYKKESKAKITK